jgi:hypothetical protein
MRRVAVRFLGFVIAASAALAACLSEQADPSPGNIGDRPTVQVRRDAGRDARDDEDASDAGEDARPSEPDAEPDV